MHCPNCADRPLKEVLTKRGEVVDTCGDCFGTWLDGGELLLFAKQPKRIEATLKTGLTLARASQRRCPRCDAQMHTTGLLGEDLEFERCSRCQGLWFEQGELKRFLELEDAAQPLDADRLERPPSRSADPDEHVATSETEPAGERDERVHQRLSAVAAGMLPLPNLFVRSAGVLILLYALLMAVLIAAVEVGYLPAGGAVAIGVAIIVIQFAFGPWLMDLSLRWLYDFAWVAPQQLPDHLRQFVERVTAQEGMRFPSFGVINDGAPNAFTYGHTPRNMRVVVSRGIFDLLEPEEVEAVVAHELGHGKHWDMLLMTVAQLVPLLAYYLYRALSQVRAAKGSNDKSGPYRLVIAMGAYLVYIVSQYLVLWFSRCREYHADRFSGRVTQNPNALASALVKIAYGLAARGQAAERPEESTAGKRGKRKAATAGFDAVGALGIFDAGAARALVAASAVGKAGQGPTAENVGKENLKSTMQWDLWNPWATFYELQSTHPLVAHRLNYLADQAAALGQEPYVVFDRRPVESYWDEFLVDVLVMLLPFFSCAAGVAAPLAWSAARGHLAASATPAALGAAVLGLGLGMLAKTLLTYRGKYFAPLTVAGLLHKVKVSSVRPVPTRLKGTVIGKGVPGLIWSEDFVMRDATGILFLDYRQPLKIWEWLFGLLKAGEFQEKEVEVTGWYRRSPMPFVEVRSIELNGRVRRCYAFHAKLAVAALVATAGAVVLFGSLRVLS
jgi:Zn-dependent protease with chaperone function/Zn-finger nucleic acid-binding protein